MGTMNTGTREATVRVHFPTHVPKELRTVWAAAAQHLANKGRLLIASRNGQRAVDYEGINDQYMRALVAYHQMGRQASSRRSPRNSAPTPRPVSASRIAAARNWPFNDLSPQDLARFGREGRWDLLGRAASLAMSKNRRSVRQTA